jgi:hypothetical protein
MIVIFSTHDDTSTHLVIEWLHHYDVKPVVINETNPITAIFFDMDNDTKEINLSFTLLSGQTLTDKEIRIVWYRRGVSFFKFPYRALEGKDALRSFYHHLKAEYETLSDYFFNHLKPKTIGDYNNVNPNKLHVLQLALKIGLNVPSTRVITSAVNAFENKHINKNLSNILHVLYNYSILYNRTSVQDSYPVNTFYPSLIQEHIAKYSEIRIFIFEDKFYAMATLPLNKEKLNTDIRDITGTESLHRFPFSLPVAIQDKITALIQYLGYSTCSIDMLLDEDGNYYFIEINPVGQFGALSEFCSYEIEKYIAQKLLVYGKGKNYQRVTRQDTATAIDVL